MTTHLPALFATAALVVLVVVGIHAALSGLDHITIGGTL